MRKRRRPYRIKRKQSLFKSRVFWYLFFSLASLSSLAYLLFASPIFQIKEVRVAGNENVSTQEILNRVVFNPILFFETKNIFLANASQTQDIILSAFPDIESVQLKRSFPNKISLIIKEKREVAVWCGDLCFAIDGNGIAFESRGEPGLLTLYTPDKTAAQIGDSVIEKDIISFVLEFQEELQKFSGMKEAGLLISSFSVLSAQTLLAATSEEWNVYLHMQKDLVWQATKLGIVFERELSPDKRVRLEYVDVRFGDQAYIKYRE